MSYQKSEVDRGLEGHPREDLSPTPGADVHRKHRVQADALVIQEIARMKELFRDGARMESLRNPDTHVEGARAGAEFEIYILDKATLEPSPMAVEVMSAVGNPGWLVKEAAKCVVEINVPHFRLEGNGLRDLEDWFEERLGELRSVPGVEIFMGGISPSLSEKHLLDPNFFSDGERYTALAKRLAIEHGGPEASVYLPSKSGTQQVKSLRLMPSGILCGIQPHLQLSADRFVDQYNAAVVSSPLHLAMNANSPAPWAPEGLYESRLELLAQGVDDKRYPLGLSSAQHAQEPWDPFFDAIQFPPLFEHLDLQSDPSAMSNLVTRNSEIWRRVRAVWGNSSDGGEEMYNVRTEHRVTGMQPTPVDSVANMALQYALTLYLLRLREQYGYRFEEAIPGSVSEQELAQANLFGPSTVLTFPVLKIEDNAKQRIDLVKQPAATLIREILPQLRSVLQEIGVSLSDVNRYLGHIEGEVGIGVIAGRATALQGRGFCPAFVSGSLDLGRQIEFQRKNIPTHLWDHE